MKLKNLSKNWLAKVLSLLLAITIWYLIKEHLATNGESIYTKQQPPPRATIVPDDPASPQTQKKR